MTLMTAAQFAKALKGKKIKRVEFANDGGDAGVLLITEDDTCLIASVSQANGTIKMLYSRGPKARPPKPPKKGTALIIDGREYVVADVGVIIEPDGSRLFDLRVDPKEV
jgi:hypothetical protein